MRKAAVVASVLCVLAIVAPAAIAVPGSGTVVFVNALPTGHDLYADTALIAPDPGAFSESPPAVVDADVVTFDLYAAGADPALDSPDASVVADIPTGATVLIIGHEDNSGMIVLTAVNALPVTLELSDTFTHVVHAANAPLLHVTELNHGFITPSDGFVLDSGDAVGTQFSVAGTNTFQFDSPLRCPPEVFGPVDVEIVEGAYNAVILAGSTDDDSLTVISFSIGGLVETNVYSAVLSGDAEVPPITTDDRGRVALRDEGSELWYTITLAPMSEVEVTAAHIHAGTPGENGPVLATLFDGSVDAHAGGGRVVQGLLSDGDLTPVESAGFDGNYTTLIRFLKAGEAYVNVHSVGNPLGEVRGDIEPLSIPIEPPLFDDIVGNTHESNISIVAQAEIALGKGDGTFAPGDDVTRGQLATFIGRTLGLDEVVGTVFPDTAGSVHEGFINAVAALGIVNGRSDGTFAPNDPVTRGQAAAMLARALDLVDATVPGPPPFTDIAGTTFEAEITVMYWIEAVNGCTATTYCPNDNLTRGQMASILSRAFGWEILLNLV